MLGGAAGDIAGVIAAVLTVLGTGGVSDAEQVSEHLPADRADQRSKRRCGRCGVLGTPSLRSRVCKEWGAGTTGISDARAASSVRAVIGSGKSLVAEDGVPPHPCVQAAKRYHGAQEPWVQRSLGNTSSILEEGFPLGRCDWEVGWSRYVTSGERPVDVPLALWWGTSTLC